ncbi:hypothetical protein VU05_01665 [Desulfobulbus sp. F1]|nr:hypothetical protein [Desulfobulbus sp. F1]
MEHLAAIFTINAKKETEIHWTRWPAHGKEEGIAITFRYSSKGDSSLTAFSKNLQECKVECIGESEGRWWINPGKIPGGFDKNIEWMKGIIYPAIETDDKSVSFIATEEKNANISPCILR